MTDESFEHGDGSTDSGLSRRRVLQTTVGVVLTTAVAGCSGGDQNGGDDGTTTAPPTDTVTPTATTTAPPTDTETPTATETASPTAAETTTSGANRSIASRCQVTNNTSELAVVGCQGEADQGKLLITTVVRNESEQTVNVFDYRYKVRVYEEDEADLANDITANRSTQFPDGRDVEPGGTLPITHRMGLDESKTPEDVELYTITMS